VPRILQFDNPADSILLRARAAQVADPAAAATIGARLLGACGPLAAVGLAACQVGEPWAVFAYCVPQFEGFLVNPVRVERARFRNLSEGCLSLEGVAVAARRPTLIAVEACLVENGHLVHVTAVASGFLAQVFDHEIDHLEGISMRERISGEQDVTASRPSASMLHIVRRN